MCEAQERNQRALHELRVMAGAWVLDLGKLQAILAGEGCNEQHGEIENVQDQQPTAA